MIKKWREFLLKEDVFSGEEFNKYEVKPKSNILHRDIDINSKFTHIKSMLSNVNENDLNLKFLKKEILKNVYFKFYKIEWTNEIEIEIDKLIAILSKHQVNMIFDDQFNLSFNPQIGIEYKNFNRFHWVEKHAIPYSLRRIGLGYKIYKKAIKDLGYISSADDNNYKTSRIWGSLLQDNDLYCVLDVDSYLVFNKEYCTITNREEIKKILKEFFTEDNKLIKTKTGIDREFQEYLQLTEDDEILWKVKEISM